jgi:hypothetical protein
MFGRRCLILAIAALLWGTSVWAQGRPHAGRTVKSARIGHQKSFRGGHRVGRNPSRGRPFGFAGRRYRNRLPRQYSYSPGFHRGFGRRAYSQSFFGQYSFSPFLPYAVPHLSLGPYGAPYYNPHYSYPSYSSYPYLYDLYYRESVRSREEANRYEAALAWELASRCCAPQDASAAPDEVSAVHDASDHAVLAPRDVLLTLDGRELPPSPTGGPLVLGSGRHTLRISARSSPSRSTPPRSVQPN